MDRMHKHLCDKISSSLCVCVLGVHCCGTLHFNVTVWLLMLLVARLERQQLAACMTLDTAPIVYIGLADAVEPSVSKHKPLSLVSVK